MITQTIEYYLKEDGQNKKYIPTKKEMDVIMEDIKGLCKYTLGDACAILSVDKNLVTFNCKESVFNDYGPKILQDPDDDGNYYVSRKNTNGREIQLGWYAIKVSTKGGKITSKNIRKTMKKRRNTA